MGDDKKGDTPPSEPETRSSAAAPAAFWAWLRPILREWSLILFEVALAFFGAWAVVSSIACLPIVDEHILLTQSDDERAELQSGFQSLQGALPQWTPTLGDAELNGLCDVVPPVDSELAPSPETAERARALQQCLQLRRTAQNARDGLADVWRERSQRASSELNSSARVAYQAALSGLAVPQRRDDYSAHLAEIHGAHMDYGLAIIAWLDACRTDLTESEARIKRDIAEGVSDGTVTAEDVSAFRSGRSGSGPSCRNPMPPRVRYPRNQRSELRLGSVTALTLKLHTTRSKDLVLLVGMLGCGLLGAGVTSLVRRRRGDDHDTGFRPATISELLSVIVSGFTAAIIVFLAVRSALPMLADGAEVKPYGLLLLCLLGAAFSDVTWRWARDYLGTRFPASAGSRTKQAAGAKPEGQAATESAEPKGSTPSAAAAKPGSAPSPSPGIAPGNPPRGAAHLVPPPSGTKSPDAVAVVGGSADEES